MGTAWSEIITNDALVVIDDVRLNEELASNPAQFFRRMSLYMTMGLPLLDRPPELIEYLTGGMTEPDYADAEWESTADSLSGQTVIDTGLIDADYFSCQIRTVDALGQVTLTDYAEAEYESATGFVVFPVQTKVGIDYVIDLYKDGEFANDLTYRQKRLLGLAIACVWDERFSRNWLNMQMKIHDNSFSVVNESNYIREVTARLKTNRALFNDELWKYEQDCAYMNRANPAGNIPILL